MKFIPLPTLALLLLLVSVSARVGNSDGGRQRNLELSQIQHRKLRRATEASSAIEGQFIFVLNDIVEDVVGFALQLISGSDAQLEFEFETVVKGFTVSGLLADLLLAILDEDMVEYVEEVSFGLFGFVKAVWYGRLCD